MRVRFLLAVCAAAFSVASVRAACVNKFTHQTDGPRQRVTLLTGKLTFQSARELSEAIRDKKAGPLEWVDEKGKTIATQFGELKVIRPMAIACDENPSGVIMSVVFPSAIAPERKMIVKIGTAKTIAFDEQE